MRKPISSACWAAFLCLAAGSSFAAPRHGIRATAAEDATDYQINHAHSGSIEFAAGFPMPLHLLWSRPVSDGYGKYTRVFIAGGSVILQERMTVSPFGSQIRALNLSDAGEAWHVKYNQHTPALAFDDGRIFALEYKDDETAFDAATGAVLWTREFKKAPGGLVGPAAGDGIVVHIAESKFKNFVFIDTQYAIDQASGAIDWRVRRLNDDPSGLGFGDGGVFVTQAFDYYKYSTTDGKRLWSVALGSHGAGHTPAYNNKRLLVPGFTSENIIRILDSGTGAILGTFPADGEITPAIYSGGAGDNRVLSIRSSILTNWNADTQHVKWSFAEDPGLLTPPVVVNRHAIVAGTTGQIHILNVNTGEIEQTLQADLHCEVGAGCAAPYLAAGDGILIVNYGNELFAYAPG